MKVEFEGRTWQYDEDRVTVKQAMALHLAHGMTLRDWQLAIPELDVRALQFCHWLMLQQNGVTVPLKDDDFPVFEFIAAYQAAQEPEAAAEAGPDPTGPPPGPPGGTTGSPAPGSQTTTTRKPPGRQEAGTVS